MADMLFIENGRVIDPANGVDSVRSVVIQDGRIVESPSASEIPASARVIDARGKWVVPGFVDLHVHLREPGQEYKETIESGTLAAVAGGFTTVCAMPNTVPPNDSAAVTRLMYERSALAGRARVLPVGCISKGMKGEALAEFGELKDAGCVALSDDGRPVSSPALMRRALEYARVVRLPLTVHEEELLLVGQGVMHEGHASTQLGLRGIPGQAEDVMVLRDIALAELTQGWLHIAHLSTAGSVRAVREAKRRGMRVTAEASPHHLTLTDECLLRAPYNTSFKMSPPLRSERDRDAVVEGLLDGTIDAIATDHAPHSSVEKDVEFEAAANGIIGLETAFAVCRQLIRGAGLSPVRLIEALTIGPARAFGLPYGTLTPGAVADVAVLDPDLEWKCDPGRFLSKSKNSPWSGETLVGSCCMTIFEGRVVWELGSGGPPRSD